MRRPVSTPLEFQRLPCAELVKTPTLAGIVAEPSRLRLLQQLLAGPQTVTALTRLTGLSQSGVSNHLARLRAARLVRAARRGRLMEYSLDDASVAQFVEAYSVLSGPAAERDRIDLSEARLCYDHLAGRLGVTLFDQLRRARAIRDDRRVDGRLILGSGSRRAFGMLGIDLDGLPATRRQLALRCLDWTERRPHLAGTLGAAIASRFLEIGLVHRRRGSRGLDARPTAWEAIDAIA